MTGLKNLGHEAVAASPSSGVNALTGQGLADVLVNADVVVDVTNSPSFEDAAVMEFFSTFTRNLLADDVVATLIDVVLGRPANDIFDLAVPTRFQFDDVVRRFLNATQDRRRIVPDGEARYFGARLVAAALVPLGESRTGATRFDGWLTYSMAEASPVAT